MISSSLEELKILHPKGTYWVRITDNNWRTEEKQPKTYKYVIMVEYRKKSAAAISLKMEDWCEYNCIDEWATYLYASYFIFSFKTQRDATLFKLFCA